MRAVSVPTPAGRACLSGVDDIAGATVCHAGTRGVYLILQGRGFAQTGCCCLLFIS